jgi:hypothetical protein
MVRCIDATLYSVCIHKPTCRKPTVGVIFFTGTSATFGVDFDVEGRETAPGAKRQRNAYTTAVLSVELPETPALKF